MSNEFARIDVTRLQLRRMRREMFCDPQMSKEERQRGVRKVLPFPDGGGRIELYCDGKSFGKA